MSALEWSVVGAWLVVGADNLSRTARAGDGTGLRRVVAGVAVVVATIAGVAVLERAVGRWPIDPGVALLGTIVAWVGVAWHLAARRTLGRTWTSRVTPPENAVLVTTGPYAVVRHPLYAAVALIATGSALVHPSFATAWAALSFAVGLALKVRAEERVWRTSMPDTYAAYAAVVPRWLPRPVRLLDALRDTLDALGAWANPTRRRYVLLLGAALWSGWIVALCRPGMLDFGGEVKGADFIQFYASARLVADGRADALYDLDARRPIEEEISGRPTPNPIPSFVPPFAALLYLPLAALPYLPAFLLWTVVSLLLLYASVRAIGRSAGGVAWSATALPWLLSFPPVFAAVSYGQNALLSTALLAATYAALARGADAWAGVALGALLYKPQLVAVTGLCLLLDRRWRAVVACGVTGAVLAAVSWAMSPAAAEAYWALRRVLPTLPGSPGFPTWNMHSVPTWFVLLFPAHLPAARAAGWLGALGVVCLVRRWQPPYARATLPAWFALAIWGTVLASPHLLIYDVSPLIPVALLRWSASDDGRWRGALVLLWPVLLFSAPLTRWLGDHTGAAFQLSTPVVFALGAALLAPPTHRTPAERTPDR